MRASEVTDYVFRFLNYAVSLDISTTSHEFEGVDVLIGRLYRVMFKGRKSTAFVFSKNDFEIDADTARLFEKFRELAESIIPNMDKMFPMSEEDKYLMTLPSPSDLAH